MMGERTKAVQIITRLDRGGSSDMVIALCERLDPDRFDVTLVSGPAADPIEEPASLAARLGVAVIECPHLGREIRPKADLKALRHLRSLLENIQPDVVHAHTSKAGALGRMAAKLAGVPAVYSPHGHLFYGYYGKLGTALVVLAERILAALGPQKIAVLTDNSRTEHLTRGIGRFDEFVTIPSGIDLTRFARDDAARDAARRELGIAREQFAVGWVGRFVEVKGPDIFVEACGLIAKELPGAVFVLAGDGPLRSEAEDLAVKLGLADRCRFLGRRGDVPAVLNACDVCVLSSRNEGLGLSVVEAMACGTPVVATDVGGVHEVLEDGRCGILAHTVEEIANATLALARDAAARVRLAQAGLKRAMDFDVDRMVAAFAELYEEMASECID